MKWRAFAFGIAGSIALHLWLIWPSGAPDASPPAPDASPAERVAVREVDPERLKKIQSQPEPQAAEVPPPVPAPAAAPPPEAAVAAAVPPPPPPQPQPVEVASAREATIEPTTAPAAVHAPLPVREPVIVASPAPTPPEMESRVAQFEAEAARLARSLPPAVQAAPPAAVADPRPEPSPQIASASPASVMPTPRVIPPVEFKPRAVMPSPKSPAFPWLTRAAPPVALAAAPASATPVAAPVPVSAAAVPTAPRSDAAPVAAPIRREPVAYRPVRFGGAGAQNQRPVSAAFAQAVDRGAMPGPIEVPQDPVARIAWGSTDEAMRLLDLGRMMLVTVDEQLRIVGGLELSGGSWRRSVSLPSLAPYSNRVRVVDHVGGFAPQASLCAAGEHLAVVVPVGLERRIERAMDDAARRDGLSRTQVSACYGRLVVTPTGVEFQVDRVERRNGP